MMQQKCHFDDRGASPMTGPHAVVRERPVPTMLGMAIDPQSPKVPR